MGQFFGQRPPAAVVGAFVEVAVHDADRQAGMGLHLGAAPCQQQSAQFLDGTVEDGNGVLARAPDLVKHGMDRRACAHRRFGHLAIPDHAGKPFFDGAGAFHNGAQHGIVHLHARCLSRRRRATAPCRLLHTLLALERRIQPHQRHRPPGQALVALVAPGGARLRQVVVAPVGAGAGVKRLQRASDHDLAHREFSGLAGRNDTVTAIHEQQRHAVLGVAQVGKDRLQLGMESKAQHHGPAGAPLRRYNAVHIQQQIAFAGIPVRGTVVLAITGPVHRTPPPRGLLHNQGLGHLPVLQAQQRMGTGIQQQDVVIDGVFGAVLLQPLAQQRGGIGVALDCRSLHKSHQRSIGGDEADIGRALEKVAHQNIDGHLGAGRQVAHAVAQVGGGNVLHHLLGQRGERGTRLVQGMQETRRLARAHDACSGVDDLPAKIQALQRSFELLQRPHLRRHDVIRQWKTHQPPPNIRRAPVGLAWSAVWNQLKRFRRGRP